LHAPNHRRELMLMPQVRSNGLKKKALATSQRAEVLIRAVDGQLIQTLMSLKRL